MSDIEKQIGNKVREIRLSKKLTQAQLAEKVGLSVESISRLERGVTFPSLKTIENMAFSLKVPLRDFFDFPESGHKGIAFERELAKLIGFLKTLNKRQVRRAYKILKVVFEKN